MLTSKCELATMETAMRITVREKAFHRGTCNAHHHVSQYHGPIKYNQQEPLQGWEQQESMVPLSGGSYIVFSKDNIKVTKAGGIGVGLFTIRARIRC
jgi:hypothetical protein